MKQATIDMIIEAMPLDTEFRAASIVDRIYPNSVRMYNRAIPALTRLLRGIKGVYEVEHGLFYDHKEFFSRPDRPKVAEGRHSYP